MATFSEQITIEGHNLLAKMLTGEANITFTKMVLGDGNVTVSEMANIRQVVSPKVTLDIHSVLKDASNNVTITSIFTNEEMEQGFYYREKGLYATDGENEILFLYGNNGTLAEWINPGGSQVIEKKIISVLTFSETQDVNVTIKSGVYVTSEELVLHNTNEEAHPNIQQRIDNLYNENLLINGDFQVWQRGEEISYTQGKGGYTSDRWETYVTTGKFDGTYIKVKKTEDGVEVSSDTSDGMLYFAQTIEVPRKLRGKNITVSYDGDLVYSAIHFNKTVISGSHGADAGYTQTNKTTKNITTKVPEDAESLSVLLFVDTKVVKTFNISWVKAEIGNNVTEFCPRCYGEELNLCMRYYEATNEDCLINGAASSDGIAQFEYNFKVTKRVNPTVELSYNTEKGKMWLSHNNFLGIAEAEKYFIGKNQVRIKSDETMATPFTSVQISGNISADAEIY